MVYMGSKRKYCKYIVPIIQKYIDEHNIVQFIDCFCGGANLADKISCQKVICNDLSPTLIALHKQAQADFSKIPEEGSREYWDYAYTKWKQIREKISSNIPIMENEEFPLYKIGAIEWYASFSNGGFPRGYAKPGQGRDYYKEGYRNHQKQANDEKYKKIEFVCGSYDQIAIDEPDTLLYCDSPYRGTKPYGISPKFDFDTYYNWLRKTSKLFPIFVSEQNLPEDFNNFIVWAKDDAIRTCGADNNFKACEKLYLIDNR